MNTEDIRFIGVDELDDQEKVIANDISNDYYGKLKIGLKNLTSVVVHVKTYSDEGKPNKHSKKYSIHVKVIAPMITFDSTHAHDWDLARTLHKAFKDLESQIRHKFHSDVSAPEKPRVPQNIRNAKKRKLA